MTPIQKHLFSLQDNVRTYENFRDFQAKIVMVPPETIIGVRTPMLRKYAKSILNTAEAEIFMQTLPHTYYEEQQLHAFLISYEKNFDKAISLLNRFLPYTTTWATTDSMAPKIFQKHTKELLPHISKWLKSKHEFTVRFGILCLMSFYLEDVFNEKYLFTVAKHANAEEYYIRMMIAWYYSVALVKQWNTTVSFLESKTLPKWVHNKTIQKAVESFRISKEQKDYLRTLRIR